MWFLLFFNDESSLFQGKSKGKSKVEFLLEIIMRFSSNSTWIQIHVAFPFLTVQSLLFQNSFDHDDTLNITYLLLFFWKYKILMPNRK